MYIIRYKSGSYDGIWCDTSIRGNVEPMTFHEKQYADRECDDLNRQYNDESYSFYVDTFEVTVV